MFAVSWNLHRRNFEQAARRKSAANNEPFQYQNGGLWSMITGSYVADLARRGRFEAAREFLDGIHWANRLSFDDEPWASPEFVHGRDWVAGGTRRAGWSAAAAVIGHHVLRGARGFQIGAKPFAVSCSGRTRS